MSTENGAKIVEAIKNLANKSMNAIGENTDMINETAKTQNFILKALLNLYGIIAFILIMLIWKVFLKDTLEQFLLPIKWWSNLSDAWQIFILSIPVLIVTQVIANVVYSKFFKK